MSGAAHAVIRPERFRIEAHGSAGDNRVPAMVERVVFLGAATQVMLRLAPPWPPFVAFTLRPVRAWVTKEEKTWGEAIR